MRSGFGGGGQAGAGRGRHGRSSTRQEGKEKKAAGGSVGCEDEEGRVNGRWWDVGGVVDGEATAVGGRGGGCRVPVREKADEVRSEFEDKRGRGTKSLGQGRALTLSLKVRCSIVDT